MTFRLTKTQLAERDRLIAHLAAKRDLLMQATTNYNAVLQTAAAFRDSLVQQWNEEINRKSGRWQRSAAAERAGDFVDTWRELGLEELVFDQEADLGHAETLSETPIEVGEPDQQK